jgi:hypothetical protein
MKRGWRRSPGGEGEADVRAAGHVPVDDATTVKFEIEPLEGFRPAGPDEVLGRVRDAVAPAVEAAKAVLEKVKEARPASRTKGITRQTP